MPRARVSDRLQRLYPNLALRIRRAMLLCRIPMSAQRLRYTHLYCMVRMIEGPRSYRSVAQARACPDDVAIMIGTIMSDWFAESHRDEVQQPGTELSWHIIELSAKLRRYSNWHGADGC